MIELAVTSFYFKFLKYIFSGLFTNMLDRIRTKAYLCQKINRKDEKNYS
jgi:hypothetical protein